MSVCVLVCACVCVFDSLRRREYVCVCMWVREDVIV